MTDFRRWFVAAAVAVLSLGLALRVGTISGPGVLAANSRPASAQGLAERIPGMLRPGMPAFWTERAQSADEEIKVQSAPPSYLISTYAGGFPGPTSAVAASYTPGKVNGVVSDRFGNTYVASSLHCVFRLDPNGLLTRVAGTCRPGFEGDGGSALEAQLNNPQGLALDPSGNLYIADYYNQRVRMVSPNGTITTYAGKGTQGYNGDNQPATSADLYYPTGLAVDSSGNLYIADQYNYRIRKVTPAGTITTVAGSGVPGTGDTGAATAAQLQFPQGVAVDASGNVYISDTDNNRVLKLTAGTLATFAGNGTGGSGAGELNSPTGLAVDYSGNLYIADTGNSRVQKVTGGVAATFAGGGSVEGDNGPATSAQINSPQSVAVDVSGNVYIADQNYRLRKVNTSGTITTVAGTGSAPFSGDGGLASLAQFGGNWGLAGDPSGNLYVADPVDFRVRKITPAGLVSTFAGNGNSSDSGDSGLAISAGVTPTAVASDSFGNIYLGGSAIVRKVATNGIITTVAGTGVPGSVAGDGGAATAATLSSAVWGLAVDSNGNLYISDTGNSCIRKVTAGVITTVAGMPGKVGFNQDGLQGTATELGLPSGLAVDSGGNLYIADQTNSRIREMAANGIVSTIAGNGSNLGSGIPAVGANIGQPIAVALDPAGNLYISGGTTAVQMVSSGTIYTIAGTGVGGYTGDGGPAISGQLLKPLGLAVISGNIYVSDNAASAVRIVSPEATAPLLTATVTDNGPFTQKQNNAAYTITVTNAANAVSTGASAVTVAAPLPASLTLVSMGGVGWSCTGTTCTSTGALIAGNSYPIDLTVSVASNAPPQVSNLVTVSGGGSPAYTALDSTFAGPGTPLLEISSTHAGDFLVGQNNATYDITVGNGFTALPTSGLVTVTEVLPPSGLSLVSLSSTSNIWNCSGASCTVNNALQGGGVYPPITVTVDVTASQPGEVTNQVTASGGGSVSATANDLTIITGAGCVQNGPTTVGDVQAVINQALGVSLATADVNGDGVVNVVDIQIVINAALGLGCTV